MMTVLLLSTGAANAQPNAIDQFLEIHKPNAYWECLLDTLPGVENDIAASSAMLECKRKHPEEHGPTPQKPNHWFGYASGDECAAKKGRDTRSQRAAIGIRAACLALY